MIGGLMLCFVLLTACYSVGVNESTAEQTREALTQTEDKEQKASGENTEEQESSLEDAGERETSSETTEDENVQRTDEQEKATEPKQRYAVNPKTYMIQPVNADGSLDTSKMDEEKIVLLTFDDTPTGVATYDILDILDKYDAQALFFVNGHLAEKNLEALHEIKDRGHLIGNHTWWHIYIRKEDPETVRNEILRLNDFLEIELGDRPQYFRPPFGQNSDVSLSIIREENMQTMNWSNGSLDWELKTSEEIVEQVLTHIKNGDNILFHDKSITAEALDPILQELNAQGYKFVLPTEVLVPEHTD